MFGRVRRGVKKFLRMLFMCFKQMMHARCLLYWVLYPRYIYFVYLRRRLRILPNSPHVSENAVKHNLRGIRLALTSDRTLSLIRPVSVIETVGSPLDARVLSIGPRSEGELFRIWSHGYKMSNIRGIDLISYSPLVDLGDMHAMPYPDNSFDVIICGWVLAYSENRAQAVQEVVRVLRPSGVAAIGVEWCGQSNEELIRELGYLPGARIRIRSPEEILAYFDGHIDHVYFNHGIVPGVNSAIGSLIVIFSIRK